MDFLISGEHINVFYLIGIGFVIGVVGAVMVVVLVGISAFVTWEGVRTMAIRRKKKRKQKDESAFGYVAAKIQGIRMWPNVHLPKADIHHSVWAILIVSFVCGIFSGFLGGGAGYVRMPSMVYLLGIPTHIAVGTDLVDVMVSA